MSRGRPIDITGQKFSRLTALSVAGMDKDRNLLWRARCDCGGEIVTSSRCLRRGDTQSCGCLRAERINAMLIKRNTKHGRFNTSEWVIWAGIVQRCTDPNSKNYRNYGGRGITVCKEWMTFERFFADMGERPTSKHSVDRIDNNRGYEPGNCRWATQREQCNNTRRNRLLEIDGVTKSVTEWCAHFGTCKSRAFNRLKLGWSPVDAVSLPPVKTRSRARKAPADAHLPLMLALADMEARDA